MPDIDIAQFNSPVPGQSLATEPGSRPWERPAKHADADEALDYYLEQLALPEITAQMLEILESGFPAADLVDAITLGGVMQGIHSIDVAVIISPIIFELITSVAEAAEIEHETGLQPSENNRVNDDSLIARAMSMSDTPDEKLMERVMSEEGDEIRKAAKGLMSQPTPDRNIRATNLEEIE